MQKRTLYTNIIGSYLLDERMGLLEKREFSEQSNALMLEAGEVLPEEKALSPSGQSLVFLGWKKPGSFSTSQDINKLTSVSQMLRPQLPKIRKAAILIAKARVRASTKKDNLIIQASNSIEELGKSINLLAKRLREWYELYNPEFSKSIGDHEVFVREISSKTKDELLASISVKPAESMGADFEAEDITALSRLAMQLRSLYEHKARQSEYLEAIMKKECPNLNAVAGPAVGSRLIALAGGLEALALLPGSKIQVLGAEKALFRHLRNKKSLPPKYGIIHEHPLIASALKKDHGRLARQIADKAGIAARIDFFKGEYAGDRLKRELDAKAAR